MSQAQPAASPSIPSSVLWMTLPPKVYFKRGSLETALHELRGRKRAFIVTDKNLYDQGATKETERILFDLGMAIRVYSDTLPDTNLDQIKRMLQQTTSFEPDVIVGLGGGSSLDAAKLLWLMYEHPDTAFNDMATRFVDVRSKIAGLPLLGSKAYMVAIPTTSGTGSEVTPFSVMTDEHNAVKYAVTNYALTPLMAIADPDLVDNMPPALTAASGFDALVHGIESYVSPIATPFTKPLSLQTVRDIFTYLPRAYEKGAADRAAREHLHYSSTVAGMAFAQAFYGICHSFAHKIGAAFAIPHGVACALLLPPAIKYSLIACPETKAAYAELAASLHLTGDGEDKLIDSLIAEIQKLRTQTGLPASLKDYGVSESDFKAKLDALVDINFADQCTDAAKDAPLKDAIRQLLLHAYDGKL